MSNVRWESSNPVYIIPPISIAIKAGRLAPVRLQRSFGCVSHPRLLRPQSQREGVLVRVIFIAPTRESVTNTSQTQSDMEYVGE